MHERAERLAGSLVTFEQDLEVEFEARLSDSSTLAFRVAFGVLRHREDAEDVAQDAFAKAHRNFRQLRDRERFRAWLVRMTWRMALDRQRSNRRREAREILLDERSDGDRRQGGHASVARSGRTRHAEAAETMEARERAERLWQAIDALPEKLRLAIVLAGIEGHDMREVGALLGVPEGTVKSRLFLARKQLKERLSWMATSSLR